MNRREFLSLSSMTLGTTLLGGLSLPQFAFAADGTVFVYTGSDQNISDFWTNLVFPRFTAAHGGTVKMVDAGDNAGLRAIADRTLAAKATKTDPQVEIFEAFDPRFPADGIAQNLWVNFKEAGLANYGKINPAAFDSDFSLPYRGSQVLLAYDATKLKAADAPTTWADLVTWIKANPGQFIYNRPDKGGSGGNFVRRAIHEVNGRDPKAFTISNYTAEAGEKMLLPAWDALKDIAPHLYEKGAYTGGNSQSLQMLGQGVVTMVPVWSDQVLQAIAQGVLPENTGLVQLKDLAFCGGFSAMTIPTNAAQLDRAMLLANFMLSEEIQSLIISDLGGFPGVSWDHVAPALREKYAAVVPNEIPVFPSGDWATAINDGWYRNVAPTLTRG
ncbi:extracellular solute-binding protein [Pannonibacter sp. SL95]|uniref:extracellular solute-binding protein n=1 Tax=Pannonibacter sp. SL95 TaxID=2995153 RepID=UPI002273043F|nr:extracellular solute-binding protein [Pannonibacter sp. SL95]MCY1705061.1 extracellular solute-binding protein [Pannonibacter sp. SL95]